MKKICLFICSLSSGGAEHQLTTLANLLCPFYEVTIATYADVPDHYHLKANIKRYRISENLGQIKKIYGIHKFFKNNHFDCIISYGQKANLYLLISNNHQHSKVIVSERNLSNDKLTFFEKLLFKHLYFRADYIVANSYSQYNFLLTHTHLDDKLKVITNYTDINRFIYTPPKNEGKIKIGIFARYNAQKNYTRFAQAVKEVNNQCLIPFKIEWYGNTIFKGKVNEDYLNFLNIIKDNHLEEIITLNDHIQDVSEKMLEMDAICLPSIFEGFSNTISEALCCGRPLIVSDVSDNHVMVKARINGFLFDPFSINSISNAIMDFLNLTFSERIKMGEKSRQIAENLFNAQSFINNYKELINN